MRIKKYIPAIAAVCVAAGVLAGSQVKKSEPAEAASSDVKEFDYTGSVQTFTAPYTGSYILECWGAQGGTVYSYEGGRGGYSVGTAVLQEGQTIYISVGGKGSASVGYNNAVGGWNGGGNSCPNADQYDKAEISGHSPASNGSGGGATSIQLSKAGDGQLKNYSSAKDEILIVAGGGGGSVYWPGSSSIDQQYGNGGYGGGTSGGTGTMSYPHEAGAGGTQSAGGSHNGSFGQGGFSSSGVGSAGGGGGLYGGGAAVNNAGGGGGSGYVSRLLANARTIAGNERFSSPSGADEQGHSGNGHVRITFESEYMFASWNTKPDGSGDTYMPGDAAPDEDLDLYAQWVPKTSIFLYTGQTQEFTAPASGTYRLETWGASGGYAVNDQAPGGKGGYSTGMVRLKKGDKLYVAVGQQGEDNPSVAKKTLSASWNGGGSGGAEGYTAWGSGGGATSVVTSKSGDGQLKNYASSKSSVLIVAGGGGGGGWYYGNANPCAGGVGGGTSGGDGARNAYSIGHGGTQTAAGADGLNSHPVAPAGFGYGSSSADGYGPGGGGGLYGGGTAWDHGAGGGGGSGFISSSLTDSETHAGSETFRSVAGGSENGHTGNGAARITLISVSK